MEKKEAFDINVKLIEEVKKYECLYNVKCPQYKQIEYKEHLWEQIGKETGKSGIESKKKWKYIRDGYKRNKQMALTQNGFHKPYKYAESLKFLDNFSSDRHSTAFTYTLADAEVSTDLSTNYEFEYEPSAKQTRHSFENSLDDDQEFLEASSADERCKVFNLNLDTLNMNKKWQMNFKLIDEVKKYECLYNMKSPKYKQIEYKERIWEKIGKKIGKNALESKKKWKNIRDSYKRTKQMIFIQNGFRKPYKYAESLKFLDNFSTDRHCQSIRPASADAEVSTDLSSDDEFQYEPTETKTKHAFEYSLNDVKEFSERSSADDSSKIGNLNIRKKWELNFKLIEEVKKYECLYNMKSPQYKQNQYKERLWEKIGKIIDKNAIECKKKWKYIRDGYKRTKQSDFSQNRARKPYKYAESLKFLDNFSTDRHCQTIIPVSADVEVSTDLSSDDEFQYESSEKSFKNSLDDVREFLDASADESPKIEHFYNDTSTIQAKNTMEEFSKTSKKNKIDNEENTVSSDEEVKEKDLSEKIIDEVKKYDCIFDLQSTQYKNFPYKKRLWHKIGKRVGLTGNDAKRRWKSVRDSYRKYRLKTITEEGFVTHYKYADALRFLEDFSAYKPNTKSFKNLEETEISTDLSSDDDLLRNQDSTSSSAKETINPVIITSQLFQLLLNKINEANLTPQEKNDIEYSVSAVVYSKLAEFNKNKIKRF